MISLSHEGTSGFTAALGDVSVNWVTSTGKLRQDLVCNDCQTSVCMALLLNKQKQSSSQSLLFPVGQLCPCSLCARTRAARRVMEGPFTAISASTHSLLG